MGQAGCSCRVAAERHTLQSKPERGGTHAVGDQYAGSVLLCASTWSAGHGRRTHTKDWLLQGKLQMICCLTDQGTKLALLSPIETKSGWVLAGSMPDHKTKVQLTAARSLSS